MQTNFWDLRAAALERKDPGKCLYCYFQLRNSRNSQIDETMAPLESWLENHLEIIAKSSDSDEMERFAAQSKLEGHRALL